MKISIPRYHSRGVLAALDRQEDIEASDPMRAEHPVAEAYGTITSHLADLLCIADQRMVLHRVGASLGSLVYWRDAWQDRREDEARGRFNPFQTQDHGMVHGRIASLWRDFGSALNKLSRHNDKLYRTSFGEGEMKGLRLLRHTQTLKSSLDCVADWLLVRAYL